MCGSSIDLCFVVVGNKCDDMQGRQVDWAEAEQFCSSHGFKFFEVSAKTGYNVSDAFEYTSRRIEQNWNRHVTSEVLHIYFNNTLISLMLDKSLEGKKIVWKDSKRKGIDQSLLYKRLGGLVWELKHRSGTYILSKSLSKEINQAVSEPFGKNGKPLRYLWDKDCGISGTARCQHRDILSSIPWPCGIGQSTPIVILSNSALLRSIGDVVERVTRLPKYITRLIVEYAYFDDNASRFSAPSTPDLDIGGFIEI